MTVLVLSDLHLGANSNGDVLRSAALREPLLRAVEHVEEVLLLGDAIELRERPVWEAMAFAEPFFRDLGDALGAGRLRIVAGNHDHALAGHWLERRLKAGPRLGLSEPFSPEEASPMAARVADWVGTNRVEFAYPGVWLRDDVYAFHGHYLDRHNTVPAFEVLGQRLVERWGRRGRDPGPDGYEEVAGPVFRASFAAAQRAKGGKPDGLIRSDASHTAWTALTDPDRPAYLKAAAAVGIPAGVGLLRALGLGPIGREISGRELRVTALRAVGVALERLGVAAEHVCFGHTHRAGPRGRDDPAEWVTAAGTQLHNDGSWVFDPVFLGPGGAEANPYWPGRTLRVGATGPPELVGLLDHLTADELTSALAQAPA